MNGRLVPMGGGDPIPLLKSHIVIGRREGCDIQLAFPNVSNRHCELRFEKGTWLVEDLGSTNGVKVNGVKVGRKRLMPGDQIAVARKYVYRIEYEPQGPLVREESGETDVFNRSLLERAGLERTPPVAPRPPNLKKKAKS